MTYEPEVTSAKTWKPLHRQHYSSDYVSITTVNLKHQWISSLILSMNSLFWIMTTVKVASPDQLKAQFCGWWCSGSHVTLLGHDIKLEDISRSLTYPLEHEIESEGRISELYHCAILEAMFLSPPYLLVWVICEKTPAP